MIIKVSRKKGGSLKRTSGLLEDAINEVNKILGDLDGPIVTAITIDNNDEDINILAAVAESDSGGNKKSKNSKDGGK